MALQYRSSSCNRVVKYLGQILVLYIISMIREVIEFPAVSDHDRSDANIISVLYVPLKDR